MGTTRWTQDHRAAVVTALIGAVVGGAIATVGTVWAVETQTTSNQEESTYQVRVEAYSEAVGSLQLLAARYRRVADAVIAHADSPTQQNAEELAARKSALGGEERFGAAHASARVELIGSDAVQEELNDVWNQIGLMDDLLDFNEVGVALPGLRLETGEKSEIEKELDDLERVAEEELDRSP